MTAGSVPRVVFDGYRPRPRPGADTLQPIDPMQRRVIAVDDDPTGTQTTAGAALITAWEPADVDWLLAQPGPIGFVLTNSRAHGVERAVAVNREVGRRLRAGAERAGLAIDVVSRSDSTLRGHFPHEPRALAEGLGLERPTWVVMPFFAEGGRVTVGGVHYVLTGDRYVPAGHTPFASDHSFGYTQSHLPAWIEEKTAGAVTSRDVTVIDIDLVRSGVDRVAAALRQVRPGTHVVIDAIEPIDVGVVGAAFAAVRRDRGPWLFRSAAGLVPALAGMGAADPVPMPVIASPAEGGLVVVGSHVPLSTRQLHRLLAADSLGLESVEADVDALAHPDRAEAEIGRLTTAATASISSGRTAVVHTSRTVRTDLGPDEGLARSRAVAEGLCAMVAGLVTGPAYLVAKGGITAHTLATDGLGARRASVVGPIIAGVPMWGLGPDSRHPGLPYVVFPGNVGDDHALAEVVAVAEQARRHPRSP
ncbi:MAG: four-carbon acid sugar kinase family protein [Actinomycetota bacterium]